MKLACVTTLATRELGNGQEILTDTAEADTIEVGYDSKVRATVA